MSTFSTLLTSRFFLSTSFRPLSKLRLAAPLVFPSYRFNRPFATVCDVLMPLPGPPHQHPVVAPPKPKLHGRAFYDSIGCPKFIIAPMVDQSELAWRLLTRVSTEDSENKGSNILAYTPMYHSRIFGTDKNYRSSSFACPPPKGSFLGSQYDRPLFVQFCSNDPEDLFRAAQYVAPYCDAVDLNLGCPQGIAKKGRYGSFLQEEWGLIEAMISKCHKELSVPITAKIRILESKERTLEYAKMVLNAGASIIAVHGRRREQKGQLTGLADWSYIRYLRDNLPPETVIFANGNILWQEDIVQCLKETGADAVMSAEGNLYNPTGLFLPASASWDEKFPRMDVVARRYLNILKEQIIPPLMADFKPNKKITHPQDECFGAVKAHLFKIFHCLVSKHLDIRIALGKASTRKPPDAPDDYNFLESYERVVEMVEKVIKEELARHPEQLDENGQWVGPDIEGGNEGWDMGNGKRRLIPYYRCQPYIRPSPEEAKAKGAIKDKKERVEKGKENGRKMEDAEERDVYVKRQKVAVEEVAAVEVSEEIQKMNDTTYCG